MSFVEKRIDIRPESGEAPFELSEVFFSRTDPRGIIQAGNYVFRRVAHMDWNKLIGAPHKIIRHPDMPKAVFWLLWDQLQKGKAVGAYVKNRAADGLYYWVFAAIVPIEGGYLSARIKPSSAAFDTVRDEYRQALAREQKGDLTPEQSAKILVDRIKSHGFDSYRDFSSFALGEELASRAAKLERPLNAKLTAVREMIKAADDLRVQTRGLTDDFHSMRTIPHNLRVIASRLEATGGPITTLSQNYGMMSREMSDWFSSNVVGEKGNFALIKDRVTQSLFAVGLLEVLGNCDRQLTNERRRLGEVDLETERAILRATVAEYSDWTQRTIDAVQKDARDINAACLRLERHVLGLSTTRVMCKIEGARLPNSGESLRDIIGQLKNFQDKVQARLERISALSDQISEGLG